MIYLELQNPRPDDIATEPITVIPSGYISSSSDSVVIASCELFKNANITQSVTLNWWLGHSWNLGRGNKHLLSEERLKTKSNHGTFLIIVHSILFGQKILVFEFYICLCLHFQRFV